MNNDGSAAIESQPVASGNVVSLRAFAPGSRSDKEFLRGALLLRSNEEVLRTEDDRLDPLGQQIYIFSQQWLAETAERLTIKDILDGLESLGMHVGDSAVRERLNDLVGHGKLKCLPGSGRRPSYYFLPDGISGLGNADSASSDADLIAKLSELINSKSEAISELESRLAQKRNEIEELKRDKQTLEDALSVRQKLWRQFDVTR